MDTTALARDLQTLLARKLERGSFTSLPILEALPVGIWVCDREGNLALSNEAARQLWGGELHVPLSEYDRFRGWFPDGRRLASEDWGLHRAICHGESVVDDQVNIETFDGRRRVIRNSAAPVLDDSGCLIGGVAVNEDITLLKRDEAGRDLFAGVLGHDLRSPLQAITMATALLQTEELGPAQEHAVRRIQSSASRIQQLVDSMLDFTRARFGMDFPLHRSKIDMGEVCARIADEMRATNPGRTIDLERHGWLLGMWDPARVSQVVSNLLANAVQHGQDPIVVTADDAGDTVRVAVSNRGEPIPPATMMSLFEPFRRGDTSRGFGLGLFIAHEILRAHGGSIEVASRDRATTFTTFWPRAVP
jgi:signal transduction histidine kinase